MDCFQVTSFGCLAGKQDTHQKNTNNTTKNELSMRKILKRITNTLFGTKCYAIIIGDRGSGDRYYVASEIHFTKESAMAHRKRIEQTHAYVYITTISFRWRR